MAGSLVDFVKCAMASLLMAGCLVSDASVAHSRERFAHVHFLNVGEGDATLIEFPCGTVLLDAGGNHRERGPLIEMLDDYFERRPDLGRHIDLMVLTHSHMDHVLNAPEIIDTFSVGRVLWNGRREAWQRTLPNTLRRSPQVESTIVSTDLVLPTKASDPNIDSIACVDIDPEISVIWGGVTEKPEAWRDYHFKDKNNHSIALKIEFGASSMLFMGDLERPGLRSLLKRNSRDYLDVDLFMISHHGYASGTVEEFVEAVSPKIAVMSRAAKHPWRLETYRLYEKLVEHDRPVRMIPVWWLPEGKKLEDYPRTDQAGNTLPPGVQGAATLTKAVYWTGLDGTITVRVSSSGYLSVL